MSKIQTTKPLRPVSGYRYEQDHKTADRCLLAIAAILAFALFSGWL